METQPEAGPAGPGIEPKIAFLRDPASYPEPVHRVEAVETHMSWVFMLDAFVYKLKKPVCYPPYDCRTLEARHHLCSEELRLNRRLAADVYLDLVPLTVDRKGRLALGGDGPPVDWLVRMRRLPTEAMLDYALVRRTVKESDLQRVAARLAQFHAALPPENLSPLQYRERLRERVADAGRELLLDRYGLPPGQVRAVLAAQEAALKRLAGVLDARVADGRIVEGHGDLRPEHVCLGEPVAIIDCLEFSRQLRILDTVDELGFLALECERLRAAPEGSTLLASYALLTHDLPPPALVHFYQSCRASSRAVLAARHVLEEEFRHSPHWIRRACHYIQMARAHIRLAESRQQ